MGRDFVNLIERIEASVRRVEALNTARHTERENRIVGHVEVVVLCVSMTR